MLKYRSDIDGLRAIAVLAVIFYHSGVDFISGGYAGVDIFFVISGYLITTLLYNEINNQTFTFSGFYKRRAARLLPALSLTLLVVTVFGFIFYDSAKFDNLGKEIFFSSFGAANILFAEGVNYFISDESYQPLIHLWSLGVEEQFYLFWPVILIITMRISPRLVLPLASVLFCMSLSLSVNAVEQGLLKGYFLTHYRSFELLIGVIAALFLKNSKVSIPSIGRQILSYIGFLLIVGSMLILNESSDFPGLNALWVCVGTALIICFPNNGLVTRLLMNKILVFVGLISYPLYLYHQPIISFVHFFELNFTSFELLSVTLIFSTLLAWMTYKYLEIPVRNICRVKGSIYSKFTIAGLVLTIPTFALIGFSIAKTNGFEARFKYLNPFAFEISNAHAQTFHANFDPGYIVSSKPHGNALFVGDSVLQQYVLPWLHAVDGDFENVDTITRGGCVLLKGVEFEDIFADISCNSLRKKLYSNKKTYDYVVISQSWGAYDQAVLNFQEELNKYDRWRSFIDQTIHHFSKLSDKVYIIGWHPVVDGTFKLQASVTTNELGYIKQLDKLGVNNLDDLAASNSLFSTYKGKPKVRIVKPYEIFCEVDCIISNGKWSYFSDSLHISSVATDFVSERISKIIGSERL